VLQEATIPLGTQALLLRGFASAHAPTLLTRIDEICRSAPLRVMRTPAGLMSVAMTNCGTHGWVAEPAGYRYSALDPESGLPWPPMPAEFLELAREAARAAGFLRFDPEVCLVNFYRPGARMGMHRDRDEADRSQPIVSVSLGLPAIFRWGGSRRGDAATGWLLEHGDVVVWGGVSRMNYHGVLSLKAGTHPLTGSARINLTFRRVSAC
jgi:alkylated DNA repair protein (DNA oxidative demethylase)